jgi:hypothetical protein
VKFSFVRFSLWKIKEIKFKKLRLNIQKQIPILQNNFLLKIFFW